jgi:hypothetical protein
MHSIQLININSSEDIAIAIVDTSEYNVFVYIYTNNLCARCSYLSDELDMIVRRYKTKNQPIKILKICINTVSHSEINKYIKLKEINRYPTFIHLTKLVEHSYCRTEGFYDKNVNKYLNVFDTFIDSNNKIIELY